MPKSINKIQATKIAKIQRNEIIGQISSNSMALLSVYKVLLGMNDNDAFVAFKEDILGIISAVESVKDGVDGVKDNDNGKA